jgi:hypothetical protein
MATDLVKWPFGEATVKALTATGNQAIDVVNDMTLVDGVTTQATGNRTIILTIDDNVKAGAILHVSLKTNGTETTTFSTGMKGKVITGVAGKTKMTAFVYDGTTFNEIGTEVQVD